MAREIVNLGTGANDGTGDPLRTAFEKINNNFSELYSETAADSQISFSGNKISANASNADLVLEASGTGAVQLGALKVVGTTINSDDSTQVTIAENLHVTGNITGTFTGDGSSLTGITATALSTPATVDNLILNDNIISSSSNADINITPGGTGSVNIMALTIDGTEISSSDSTQVTIKENLHVTGNITGTLTGSVAFSNVTSTPTTLAGYGITDAASSTATALTVVGDDSSGTAVTLGESFKIAGATGITTAVSGDTLTITGPTLTSYITASSSDTLTNKTIDANGTGNSISNIEVADFAAASIVTQAEGVGSNNNDTTIPTSAAVKAYADSVGGAAAIGDITFTGSTISSPSNADITLTPGGTGAVDMGAIRIRDNHIEGTRTNDDVIIDPAGTGLVRMNTDKIALGTSAGATSQGADAVAIGKSAGSTSQGQKSVAIGDEAGTTSQSQYTVAIGRQAGNNTQGEYSVAVGTEAGEVTQGTDSVAIGRQAGYDQGNQAVHVGAFAGGGTSGGPGTGSIGIGKSAGVNSQSTYAIAVGFEAGVTSQGTNSIAIGKQAGNNDITDNSIAIGTEAGKTNSGSDYTTAIGYQAAYTGGSGSDRAVAIGFKAGYTTLNANSIVLNAHNGELNTVGSGRFYVKPVRSQSGNSQPLLRYDEDSGEISFMPHIEINDNLIQTVQTNADLELSGNGTGATKINGKLVISASQADGSSVAIDTTKSVAVLAGNTGSDDNDYTLADGTTAGQIIYLVRGPNSSRDSIHVTFSKFENDGTTASNTRKEIFSQYMSVVPCIWNGTAWCVGQHQN